MMSKWASCQESHTSGAIRAGAKVKGGFTAENTELVPFKVYNKFCITGR